MLFSVCVIAMCVDVRSVLTVVCQVVRVGRRSVCGLSFVVCCWLMYSVGCCLVCVVGLCIVLGAV